MKMENGEFITYNAPYGYKLDKECHLLIVPEEAEVIRRIFELYLSGKGMGKIAETLNDENIPNASGKWSVTGIRYILLNEKYIGDSILQKTYTPCTLPLKNIPNRGELDMYYVSNSHEGIISRETFELAKRRMSQTTCERKSPQKHLFTGIIECESCDWAYKRKVQNGVVYWVCSRKKSAGHFCESKNISEENLKKAFVKMYYIKDLKNKYDIVMNQAKKSGADDESLRIIIDFSARILKSLELYYKADIAESNNIILELVKDIGNNSFAVNSVNNSEAFPGVKSNELQFFRSRLGSPNKAFKAKDMIHLPNSMRAKSGNYRFSIPGNPSMYLANSSYGCWIETGCPAEIDFNVSPVLLEGNQKIFNLAVSLRDFRCLNEFEKERVHCWLKLYLLTIATSYVVKEDNRTFKSEYIISQSLMMACKKWGTME